MRMLVATGLAVSWLSSATAVLADPPQPGASPPVESSAEADRLFEEARTLARANRFDEACQRFAQSDALEQTFGTAVNLGDCAEREGHPARAWQRFDDAARTADRNGSRELAKFARDRAAAIAPKLCTVVVRIAALRMAGLTIRVGERTLPPAAEVGTLVEPGRVEVTVGATGAPAQRQTVACAAGAIAFARFPVSSPPGELAYDPGSSAAGGRNYKRGFAIGTGAAAAVSLAIGAGFGIAARHRQNDAHALCPSPLLSCAGAAVANDLIRSGHRLAIDADILFGVGALATIASGVLWFASGERAHHTVAIVPTASLDQIAITARGSF